MTLYEHKQNCNLIVKNQIKFDNIAIIIIIYK